MQQALPCPPVFRPSARVRWSNCRPLCPPSPGPWLLARRLGEARRPGSGVGVVLDLGPLRSAAFVRASFSARRGVRLGCRICSVRPVRAGFSGDVWCSTRWAVPGRSARCDRLGRASRSARCSTRCGETSHFTRAPARRRSRERASRSARCSTRCRRTVVFTWWRTWRPLRSVAVQQPVGVSGIAARLELPEPDERRHAGGDRFVAQVLQFTPESGHKPLGGCGASIWRSASTGASVQRLGGARPQPQGAVRSVPSSSPRRARSRCRHVPRVAAAFSTPSFMAIVSASLNPIPRMARASR